MEAFQRDVPDLFHRGGAFTITTKHESSLDQIKTFAEFHNVNHSGIGDTMRDMVPQVKEAISSYITEHYQFGSEMYNVMKHCLGRTSTWLMDLLKFIQDNQESYTGSQFSPKTAWALNSKLVKRIFGDLGAGRAGIRNSFKIGNTRSIALQCIWGSMKTHQVMEEYRKFHFKNHPSMSSEHIKFIATNMGLESITRLETRCDAMEKEVKAMSKSVQEALNASKTATNKITDFLKKQEAMENGSSSWS